MENIEINKFKSNLFANLKGWFLGKLTIGLILLNLVPMVSKAALTVGNHNSNSVSVGGGATTATMSLTQPAGSNGFMIVYICTPSTISASSVTYAGSNLTKLSEKSNPANVTGLWSCWYLASPTAGAGTVTVTLSACPYGYIHISGYNFTGSSGIGVNTYSSTNTSDKTVSLTVSSNSVIVASTYLGGSGTGNTIEIPTGTSKSLGWNNGNGGVYSFGAVSASLSSGATIVHGSSNTNFGLWGVEIQETAALPIELLSFKAELIDNKVNINWKTASEINNDYFILEKSIDALSWIKVAEIKSAENSNMLTNYSWIDESYNSSLVYYRLTQIDKDGTQKTFDIISISSPTKKKLNEILLYPNPTSNYITLEYYSELTDEFIVKIESDFGTEKYYKKHQIKKGHNLIHISVDSFLSGLYFVSIENNLGEKVTQKLIKD